ncbi:hypothetical protein DENSPDRAFT_675415 [Dentipellis sp. KUC8613]|nr:hypothetical protein DENSPDRAFT_675415 [Dentipellis sp. KUC8613]
MADKRLQAYRLLSNPERSAQTESHEENEFHDTVPSSVNTTIHWSYNDKYVYALIKNYFRLHRPMPASRPLPRPTMVSYIHYVIHRSDIRAARIRKLQLPPTPTSMLPHLSSSLQGRRAGLVQCVRVNGRTRGGRARWRVSSEHTGVKGRKKEAESSGPGGRATVHKYTSYTNHTTPHHSTHHTTHHTPTQHITVPAPTSVDKKRRMRWMERLFVCTVRSRMMRTCPGERMHG